MKSTAFVGGVLYTLVSQPRPGPGTMRGQAGHDKYDAYLDNRYLVSYTDEEAN
jgi:hypothetical protein